MEIDNTMFLLYDKYDSVLNNHNYSNINTKNISLKDLFSEKCDKYVQKVNDDAIDIINKSFDKILRIPELDMTMYTVLMFVAPNKSKYTLVGVNMKIQDYVKTNKPIPNEDFLKTVCNYHICYSKTEQTNGYFETTESLLVKANVTNIIEKVTNKTEDITDLIMENPQFLTCKLFDYQNKSVNSMLNKEKQIKSITYNLNDEIVIGNIYYDSIKQTFISYENRNILNLPGGALIDEVGLGKTIQMTTLSLLNSPSGKELSYTRENKTKIYSKATLIICPNQICPQWSREILDKVTKETKLSVIMILTKVHFDKYTYQDLLDADFVIVSYNFLENKNFLESWLDKICSVKNYHKNISKLFDRQKLITELDKIGYQVALNPNKLFDTNVILPAIHWNRIIIDEFHEIYTVQKYKYLINIISLFQSTYKWCVTGTPFNNNTNCLYSMLDYVSDYNNPYGEKIFLDKTMNSHMMTNFFRRNTKKSIEQEYKLDPLEETVVMLNFSTTERMMYNAFLANPNNDPQSVFLRKICCHPKLADEIKDIVSNCKTLADIEKVMIKHHELTMNEALEKVVIAENKIPKREKKIALYEMRRKKRILRVLGYNGIIDKEKENELKDTGIESDADIESDSDSEQDVLFPNGEININDANDTRIMKIIGVRWNDKRVGLDNMYEGLKNLKEHIIQLKKEFDGKKITYDFFKNSVEQVKKICNKKVHEKNGDSDSDSDSASDNDEETCPICLGEIPQDNIGITKCGHRFCYACIKITLAKKNMCPYCKTKISEKDIFMISYEKYENKNNDKDKNKDILDKKTLINEVGTKLANLIYYLKQNDKHTIIFSQWDDLLHRVGDVLTSYKIKNVFCRGNVWMRDKAIRTFSNDDDIKVIMLSSESAASGTNLTKASQVIILDPIIGSYEFRRNMEGQAIGRAHRMGQKNKVTVVRFVIKNTIEETIYNDNKITDLVHKNDIKIFETTEDNILLKK